MATITSVLEDPQVKIILDADKAEIEKLTEKVETLKAEKAKAHTKATNRRIAIKGLERRAEHLEHLLSAARGTSEKLNKEQFAVATLIKMTHGDVFAAFDALLEYGFKGRVDELVMHIDGFDTEDCDCGCGEYTTDAICYDSEGRPHCRTCYERLTADEEDHGL